jgi:hypothetical protein
MFMRSRFLFPTAINVTHKIAAHPRFFNTTPSLFGSHIKPMATIPLPAYPYSLGPTLTLDYTIQHITAIHQSREELKYRLDAERNQDLCTFVDVLFDFKKFSALIHKVDKKTQKIITKKYGQLFQQYNEALTNPECLDNFLRSQFLPALRNIVHELAKHYQFDTNPIESIDGILLDADFMELIEKGKLILDMGEDGHGPLPHIIAAFMMAELQHEGAITSAVSLYQSLSQRSNKAYCTERVDFRPRFSLLLDSNYAKAMFSNPASFSNHVLSHSDALQKLNAICKNHSKALTDILLGEAVALKCPQHYSMGTIIDTAKYPRPK